MPGTVEFRWPLGDVISALARAGMRIELLDEYTDSRQGLSAEQVKQLRKLPTGFVLLATKDRESKPPAT